MPLVSNDTLHAVATAIYPALRPVIERNRTVTDDDIRAAIKATPDLPSRPNSERSLQIIAEHICEM